MITKTQQTQNICKGYILSQQNKVIDAFSCQLGMNAEYGINVNWHEFSSLLDQMKTSGIIKLSGHDNSGMCQYVV